METCIGGQTDVNSYSVQCRNYCIDFLYRILNKRHAEPVNNTTGFFKISYHIISGLYTKLHKIFSGAGRLPCYYRILVTKIQI
jgi:hypothetical protein